jgi:predicted hotdog family 3-hydroxylacyl-ACP dehydratase
MNAPLPVSSLAALIPHTPPALVIEAVLAWDAGRITCQGRAAAAHPFAVAGALAPLAAAEYGLQAAALHGALTAAGTARPGLLVRLRGLALPQAPLRGAIEAWAERLASGAEGALYRFGVRAEAGELGGTAVIAFAPASGAAAGSDTP